MWLHDSQHRNSEGGTQCDCRHHDEWLQRMGAVMRNRSTHHRLLSNPIQTVNNAITDYRVTFCAAKSRGRKDQAFAFDQASIAYRLPLATSRACQESAPRESLQLGNRRMRDMSAMIAPDADCIYTFQLPALVTCCIKIENIEKASVGHRSVPFLLGNAAAVDASVL